MATTLVEPQEFLSNPLSQLPSPVKREYKRGQLIYSCHEPSTSIYLVIAGKVKLSRVAADGRRVVVDIYQIAGCTQGFENSAAQPSRSKVIHTL